MIEHTSNMPFSSIIRPSNGLGAIACYDSFENKLGVGISPSSIPNAHYLTFRRALLCAPNNIWKSRNYPSFITSSLFSLFTHHSFIHSSLPSFLWEVLVHCCIRFGRGALVTMVYRQVMVVVVVGVAINDGGKVLELRSSFDPYKTYILIICKLYKISGLIIHNFYITYGLSFRKKLMDWQSVRTIWIGNS